MKKLSTNQGALIYDNQNSSTAGKRLADSLEKDIAPYVEKLKQI
ncbi:hypothetical protein [Bacillus sp. FJAT-45037]|nr:hypothetical protein [Bacillus sp. FJAT-45037]